MDYGFWAVIFLAVGTAIVVAEFFLPSGGLLGIISACCIFASTYCAYVEWYKADPGFFWTYITFEIFVIPTAIGVTLFYLPKTAMGKKILLAAPELQEVTPFAEEEARLTRHIGKRGKTLTMLNPGGMVLVDGERLHCFSEGMMIDPQTEVEIVKVSGTRVMVSDQLSELAPEKPDADNGEADLEHNPDDALAETQIEESSEDEPESRLDFEIPQT